MTAQDVAADAPRIHLNDLLQIDDLSGWKVSLYRPASHGWDPREAIREFRSNKLSLLEEHHGYQGLTRSFTYTVGTKVIGLAQLKEGIPRYLLTNIAEVTDRDDARPGVTTFPYKFKPIGEYAGFEGRVVVDVEYKSQQGRVWASSVMDGATIHRVLEPEFEFDDDFPGYHNVNLSWRDLARIITSEAPSWKTALRNQKGVYLITDASNGKHYVGSAYGADELWGRWSSYVATGHGNNVELRTLPFAHIRENFHYTLLETTGALTEAVEVIRREGHWKQILWSRSHGYNSN